MHSRLITFLSAAFVLLAAFLGLNLYQSLETARANLFNLSISPPRILSTISFGKSRAGVIVANPYTSQVFAAMEDVPALASIDAKTDAIVQEIPLRGYHTGMVMNFVKNEIYVAQEFSQTVRVIDGATNKIAREIPVPGGSPIGELAFDSNANFLYVIRNDIQTIAILDYRDGVLLGTLPIDAHYGDVAINPQTQRLYVTSPLENKLSVVDTTNNSIVAAIPIGKNPTHLAVNPATNRIYVAVADDKVLAVIDGATNTIVATIPLGEGVVDVGVNPFTNRVYFTLPESKELGMVDGNTNRLLTRLKLNAEPGQIAVLPHLNRIFVTSDEAKGVLVIQDTPDASLSLVSDESVRALRLNGDAPPNWTQPDFDDGAWGNAGALDCIANAALRLNTAAKWIWMPGCSQYKETALLRKTFDVPSARAGRAVCARERKRPSVSQRTRTGRAAAVDDGILV